MKWHKKIIVVVPAYNEERSIAKTLRDIKNCWPDIDVLVINDGSLDHTSEEARKQCPHVIDLPYNLGIGGAIQCGFKYAWEAGYDIAVQIDGDGQHDPKYIEDILIPVVSEECDLCIGSRFLNYQSGFKSTFARRLGINFFSGLISFLTKTRITDPTSGFRAYNRKIIQIFIEDYPIDFPEPEAVVIAKRYNARIKEVPARMRKRIGGISSIRYFKTLYYMIKVTSAILIDLIKKK